MKLFTGVNVSVKWLGRKKRKLTIASDDINKTLIEKMKIIAAKSKNINTHKKLSEVCAAKQSEQSMAKWTDIEEPHSSSLVNASDINLQPGNSAPSQDTDTVFCQKSNSLNSCSCYCKNFASQLERIEDDLLQLRSRMDVREIEGLKLPCDNTSLRKEKDRLQSELELAKCTISKLEAKISELQNEKSTIHHAHNMLTMLI